MADERTTEDLLDTFDQRWRGDVPPQIAEFLQRARSEGVYSSELLSELVKIDLEYRYRWPGRAPCDPAGNRADRRPPQLETYLRAFPDLQVTPDLLVEECRVRFRFGRPADTAEIRERFPELYEAAADRLSPYTKLTESSESGLTDGSTLAEISRLEQIDSSNFATPLENQPGADEQSIGPRPDTIGRYQVSELLGRGGFGIVWRAHDPKLLRDVAIKSVTYEAIGNPQRLEMLLQEARSAASLHHAGLVTVFDVLEKQGQIHLVMELVDGVPLHRWSKGRRPETAKIIRLMADVATAVHAAHRGGLIHCDLKPANILVDGNEQIHVTDFGLSVRPALLQGKPMAVFGTPAYMAPEQIRGDTNAIDARTDIWALGVVLFQLIHDRLPFATPDPNDIFDTIQHAPPATYPLPDDSLSSAVRTIYLRCLSKDPSARFSSAEQLATTLYQLLGPISLASISTQPRHPKLPALHEQPMGRDTITQTLVESLTEGRERLITITGPGGVGKTSVALAVAHQLNQQPGHLTYWVDLANVHETHTLATSVLRALGVPTDGKTTDANETVAETLALRGRVLLVLDNFEQLAEQADGTVGRWLERASELRCLVTSQSPLGLTVERRVGLSPLLFPALEQLGYADRSLASVRQRFPAVDLFLSRAEKVGANLEDDPAALEHVCAICQRLDGLPLALELAAARTSMLPIESISQRLTRSTQFLRSRHQDTPDRHRTLQAAIGWGFEGLSEAGQQAIVALGQLPTGCTIEFAERLLEQVQVLEEAACDPLEVLQELEDRSLLVRDRNDSRRIGLLGSVREFTRTWIKQHASPDFDNHVKEAAVRAFDESRQLSGTLYSADSVNLWQAAEWGLEIGDDECAARLALQANEFSLDQTAADQRAGRLAPFASLETDLRLPLAIARAEALFQSGETEEAISVCQTQLERLDDPQNNQIASANLRRVYGITLVDHGDVAAGQAELTRSVQIAEQLKEWRVAVQSLSKLAHSKWRGGDVPGAITLLDKADKHLRAANDKRTRIDVLRLRGVIDLLQGHTSTAGSRLHEAAKLARELGDRRILRDVLQSMAAAMAELGRFDEALDHSDRAERLSRMLGDRRGIARALNNRALFLIDQGAPDAALAILEDAERLYRQINQPDGLVICHTTAGSALLADEQYAAAKARLEQALASLGGLAGSIHHAVILGECAAAEFGLGNCDVALSQLRQVAEILGRCGAEQSTEAFLYQVLQAEILSARDDAGAKAAIRASAHLRDQLGIDQSHPRQRVQIAVEKLDALAGSL